ncbi:MAG TPA: TonB-dependent receptor, partial [Paludibacteraceae bacterium]|nr:TonB-dependent receptor [Paludibacteraceae bacterium]
YSKDFQHWYCSTGIATTHSSSFGQNTFGGFDIAFAFTDEMRIFFSANSAIRLPTFTDLYYQSATQISNPNLKPETSKNLELGIKSNQKNLQWNICTYYRAGKNIIDWIKHPDSTKWISSNLIHINAFGTDFHIDYQFIGSFLKSASFSYSYLYQDKNAEQFDSKYALDYLKHKANLKLEHPFWKNLTGIWAISYFDRAGNYTDFQTGKLVNYKPYLLADFQINWAKSQYEIYSNLNNLLNVHYEDYGGIAQPGFTFNVGFRWKFL